MIHAAILLFYATASIFLGGTPASPPETKPTIVTVKFFPKRGTILRHENFRGYQVPIKADGAGGSYRWIADVPWDEFTIEEKFDMARVNGGYLNERDIEEIRRKYTKP